MNHPKLCETICLRLNLFQEPLQSTTMAYFPPWSSSFSPTAFSRLRPHSRHSLVAFSFHLLYSSFHYSQLSPSSVFFLQIIHGHKTSWLHKSLTFCVRNKTMHLPTTIFDIFYIVWWNTKKLGCLKFVKAWIRCFRVRYKTRSSWLNCALRDDEGVYWVSLAFRTLWGGSSW